LVNAELSPAPNAGQTLNNTTPDSKADSWSVTQKGLLRFQMTCLPESTSLFIDFYRGNQGQLSLWLLSIIQARTFKRGKPEPESPSQLGL